MSQPFGAERQRRQHPPQQQQQDGQGQRQDGSRQSQWQGGRPADKPSPTTADPGADGQSVYDVQDDEVREGAEKPLVPPWKTRPDSNAM